MGLDIGIRAPACATTPRRRLAVPQKTKSGDYALLISVNGCGGVALILLPGQRL